MPRRLANFAQTLTVSRLALAAVLSLGLAFCTSLTGGTILIDYEDRLTSVDGDTWKRSSVSGIHRIGFDLAFCVGPLIFWIAVALAVAAVVMWFRGRGGSSPTDEATPDNRG